MDSPHAIIVEDEASQTERGVVNPGYSPDSLSLTSSSLYSERSSDDGVVLVCPSPVEWKLQLAALALEDLQDNDQHDRQFFHHDFPSLTPGSDSISDKFPYDGGSRHTRSCSLGDVWAVTNTAQGSCCSSRNQQQQQSSCFDRSSSFPAGTPWEQAQQESTEQDLGSPQQVSDHFIKNYYHTMPYRCRNKPRGVRSSQGLRRWPRDGRGISTGRDINKTPVSPILQLYMESSDPMLDDYVRRVLRLTYAEPDRQSSGVSSLTSWPTCRQTSPAATTVIEPESAGEGTQSRPLKPTVEKEVCALRRQAAQDVILGVFRNLACYMLLVGVVLIVVQGGISFYVEPLWKSIVPVVLLGIGVIGIALQVKHVVQECRHPKHRTLLAQMLSARTKYHSAFINMINKRITNAPYVAIEIKKKHRVEISPSKNKGKHVRRDAEGRHWLRISKKISKIVPYDTWCDRSKDISEEDWQRGRCHWIIVAKDYRAADQETELAMHEEVKQFCQDNAFGDADLHGKQLKLLLDVTEGEAYPDVQAYLVCPDRGKSCFYTFSVYKATLYMGLDSLYSIAFHAATCYIGHYPIVKVMERSRSKDANDNHNNNGITASDT